MLRFCIHFTKFANFFRRFRTAGNLTHGPLDTGKLAGSAKRNYAILGLKQTNKQTKNVIIYISYIMYIYTYIIYIYIYIYLYIYKIYIYIIYIYIYIYI